MKHYYGYGGRPTVGVLCGAKTGEVTGYAQQVTCPTCLSLLAEQFSKCMRA